jgi:hypothetical protein
MPRRSLTTYVSEFHLTLYTRKDIARALTAAAPAMIGDGRGRPDDAAIRRALLGYAFNTRQRDETPADVA